MLDIDKDSWGKPLHYPINVMEHYTTKVSKDTLVMETIADQKIVGVIFTQRIVDETQVDSIPWYKGLTEDTNVNEKGDFFQLKQVCTLKGGSTANKHMPGKSLRDFALLVTASHGIQYVSAITRATDFDDWSKKMGEEISETFIPTSIK